MLTVGNISNESIEEEHPCQRIKQCFLQLMHLEVLVTYSLLILPDTLKTKDLILL